MEVFLSLAFPPPRFPLDPLLPLEPLPLPLPLALVVEFKSSLLSLLSSLSVRTSTLRDGLTFLTLDCVGLLNALRTYKKNLVSKNMTHVCYTMQIIISTLLHYSAPVVLLKAFYRGNL